MKSASRGTVTVINKASEGTERKDKRTVKRTKKKNKKKNKNKKHKKKMRKRRRGIRQVGIWISFNPRRGSR